MNTIINFLYAVLKGLVEWQRNQLAQRTQKQKEYLDGIESDLVEQRTKINETAKAVKEAAEKTAQAQTRKALEVAASNTEKAQGKLTNLAVKSAELPKLK